jgi:hypothetical protein
VTPFFYCQISTSVGIAAKNQATPVVWTVVSLSTNWPVLLPASKYWLVVAPGVRSLSSGDGALWVGFNASSTRAPPSVAADPQLYTARELRVPGGCASAAALQAILNTPKWSSAAGVAYKDYQASGSVWRYGLSIIGTPRY